MIKIEEDEVIVCKVYKNKNNSQITLQPQLRNISEAMKKIINNQNIKGLKMKVIKLYYEIPKQNKTKQKKKR